MCNQGAEEAKGKYLLFLNDDVEIIEGKWLNQMMELAIQFHIGAVGARLLYPQAEGETGNRIQHAGITNMGIGPAHKLAGLMDEGNLYHGHNLVNYNMIAVTGACLLLNREKFRQIQGFDEELAVAYNDVHWQRSSVLRRSWIGSIRSIRICFIRTHSTARIWYSGRRMWNTPVNIVFPVITW